MSRKLWVWFSYGIGGVHRKVGFSAHCSQLLNAIFVANVAALVSLGKTPTTFVLLLPPRQTLQHVPRLTFARYDDESEDEGTDAEGGDSGDDRGKAPG